LAVSKNLGYDGRLASSRAIPTKDDVEVTDPWWVLLQHLKRGTSKIDGFGRFGQGASLKWVGIARRQRSPE
jgi:hypothetical protein